MKRIDSVKNELVKNWKKLHTKRGREKSGTFLVEGFHLVEEALKGKVNVEYILMTEDVVMPSSWIVNNRDLIIVSNQVMKEISETQTPQGIAAICALPTLGEFERVEGKYLVIDRVQDPGNVGTMIRTATQLE